uniref:Homogentisate 1,2-dioxygenase n=1 Tax=Lygus hesperus TaxID=30085 RepID=A0A0A9YPI3_LYGHE
MFEEREKEGAYNILITRQLLDNGVKFKEFFRFTPDQFFTEFNSFNHRIHNCETSSYSKYGEPRSRFTPAEDARVRRPPLARKTVAFFFHCRSGRRDPAGLFCSTRRKKPILTQCVVGVTRVLDRAERAVLTREGQSTLFLLPWSQRMVPNR